MSSPKLHLVLYEPEIPANTGNIIRLCANVGAELHVIHPLGFELNAKQVRRAGLDYHDLSSITEHDNWQTFCQQGDYTRIIILSSKVTTKYSDFSFLPGDALVFGPETRGLPKNIIEQTPMQQRLTIPMLPNNRSLNLSNAVAVVAYEAWRQLQFCGCA